MFRSPLIPLATGAAAVALLAMVAAGASSADLTMRLSRQAAQAIAEAGGRGVEAHFVSPWGGASRHPLLTGGERLDEKTRDRTAKAVAAVPGVGGIRWQDGSTLARGSAASLRPLHCQEDVEALLRARTIRFEEGSARIDAPSRALVAEVAEALRPCLGAIIAINGHTDTSGPEPGNLALSRQRADAVRRALVTRGIPADGLRARGVGSAEPVEGLEPTDPANRRIEFSVIETMPIKPTAVDTPVAR
jgi:OOP family OmpA-OmpF porin